MVSNATLSGELTQDLIDEARKLAGLLTTKEISAILSREKSIRLEAEQITTVEIPELIKYLDYLYPTQDLIGFKDFCKKRGSRNAK